MLLFPPNPSTGTQVTAPNGTVYEWDGGQWIILRASGGGTADWGSIGGNILDQPDLEAALDEKMALVPAAISAHLAEFDSAGQVVDVGEPLSDITDRLDSMENLGHFVGSFNTRALVPANTSGFTAPVTVNDFVTVRADETQSGATTRYIATTIAGNGAITWTYDVTYSTDISGKMDLVTPAPTVGNLAEFGAGGQVVASTNKAADFLPLLGGTLATVTGIAGGGTGITASTSSASDAVSLANTGTGSALGVTAGGSGTGVYILRNTTASTGLNVNISTAGIGGTAVSLATGVPAGSVGLSIGSSTQDNNAIQVSRWTPDTSVRWTVKHDGSTRIIGDSASANPPFLVGTTTSNNPAVTHFTVGADGVAVLSPPLLADCDTPFTTRGVRIYQLQSAGGLNKPDIVANADGMLVDYQISATWAVQFAAMIGSTNLMFARSRTTGAVWQPWREVLDSAFLTARTISNVAMDDLQATIDSLPRYLNRDITINTIAGVITTDITISRFTGPGILTINGTTATTNFAGLHSVNRIVISNCTVSRMSIRGITTEATTGTGWAINNCSMQYLYLYYCAARGGDPTVTSNLGFYANESSHVYCSECLVEDKFKAFWGRSGRLRVGGPRGSNNTWGFDAEYVGIVQLHGTIPATLVNNPNNLYRRTDFGGITIGVDGNEQSTVPARRTSDIYLTLTTDDLAAHGSQTLATYLKSAVQNTIFLSSTTIYSLRVFIRPGVSTTAALRCIGLDMQFAYVVFYVDPGVTLSSITMWGNRTLSLNVINCGNINGSVDISYNLALVADVYYLGNYATTVLPVYPTGHPLAAQPVPIERSRVTGGIMMQRNRAHNVYCSLGQFCEVGLLDANDTTPDPAVGTTSNGVIQILYNKCTYSAYVYLYATYMENLSPPIPGPKVANRIYVYQNECNDAAYINNMSSWTEEGRPESENCYVYYNKCANAYIAMGSSSPATSFTGYFTATAAIDNSTASRNTVTFTAPLNAAWANAVVGMGFTFINEGTTSLAGNYTGTFKTVTAYDSATNTITLSANFTNPRHVTATGYFFSGAGQTRFYYGTSPKIQHMAEQALADNRPVGFRQIDNNNLGTAFRITAVDTTTKVLTITPGLPSYGLYTSANYVCGLFGPNTVGNHSMTFHKIAANQFRSVSDQRVYSHIAEAIVGCKVTGGGIPAGQHRVVATAAWGGAGFESRLIMTFDSDDDAPVSTTTTLTYIVRRVPFNAHHAVVYNTCMAAAYGVIGHWGSGSNGGVKIRSFNNCYNVAGTTAHLEVRDFMGNAVNPGGATRCSYADVIYNTAGSAAYIIARGSGLPGGGGGFDRVRLYRNRANDEAYIQLGSYTTVDRPVELYYNVAGYRCYLDCALPGGVTISATSAPQLKAGITMYRNISPQIWVNRMNVKPALIGETGRAPDLQCWNVDGNVGRTYVGSASLWLDISNNTAANAACIYSLNNSYFEYGFAVPSTYGGTQCYALRLNEAQRVKISARPATMPKVKIEGYSLVHFASTLALDNIYKDDHLEGRGANVVLLQRGEPIDDPRAPVAYYTTPGTYTFVVPITGPWIVAAGGAGGGGAVYLDGTPVTAGGGSGAIASAHSTTNLTAGTSLTVTVGARGTAFVGAATAGAGTAGGNSSVTGGGITVTGNGGGGGTVNATTGTGGAGGTYTVTGMVNTASENGDVGTAASGGKRHFKDLLTMQGRIVVGSGRGGSATATGATAGFDGSVLIFLDE